MNVLISACLLGMDCRYDGKNKKIEHQLLQKLQEKYTLVPVCPEIYGGLPIPREPVERRGDRFVSKSGVDVTQQYQRGAQAALGLARTLHCQMAILKERSPSCGSVRIYDGSFTGNLMVADGVTAELLMQNGIRVCGESQILQLIAESQDTAHKIR